MAWVNFKGNVSLPSLKSKSLCTLTANNWRK